MKRKLPISILFFLFSMSKLLVTGSRTIKNREVVFSILDETIKDLPNITELHHGGARGVDLLAGEWATEKGLAVFVHRPKGYAAYEYIARDRVMVDLVDHVVTIWDGQSKGTARRRC
jgi:hypothetical protein